jgi:chemotaxis protein methyltransferase CheR
VGRLGKVLRRLKLSNFNEYYDYVCNDKSGAALSELIERISTNHSYFFREQEHFSFMRSVILPDISAPLRIWSAGSAAGEEIYTIAMILDDYFGQDLKNHDIGLLATDISDSVLEQAMRGIYPVVKTKEIPPGYFSKYFDYLDNDKVSIKPFLKDKVLFKKLNLMSDVFPFKGKFDIIFCRNVMIYFDTVTRDKLIGKFYYNLNNGGYLFIGHSESIPRWNSPLKYIKPAIYRKIKT